MTQIGHIVIGLIVVVAVVYLLIFILQRWTAHQVAKMAIQQQEWQDAGTRDRIVEDRKMSLMGQTLADFKTLEAQFNQFEEVDLGAAKEQTDKVLFDTKGINFWETKRQFKHLQQQMAVLDEQFEHINAGLQKLETTDAEHKAAVKELESKYKDLRKTLLAKNFTFGEALDKLEDVLAALEDEFADFTKLTEDGDHAAASSVYETLAMETNQLEERMVAIPELVQKLDQKIPAQQSELQNTYDNMVIHGYNLQDQDIQKELNQIETDRQTAKAALAELTLKTVQSKLTGMQAQIDQIYASFEQEYNASLDVQKGLETLQAFLGHVQEQNQELSTMVSQYSENYIFDMSNAEAVQGWGRKLLTIEKQLDDIQLSIANQTIVYSKTQGHLQMIENELKTIEADQLHLFDNLKILPEIGRKAKENLEQAQEELRTIHRRVERQGLPGVPSNYLNFFDQVVSRVEKLSDVINAPRINVDEFQRQMSVVSADLDNLKEMTKQMLEAAQLTGSLVRKANQYRDNAAIGQAVQQAQREYNQFYNFDQAVQILGQQLDRLEPGTTARLQQQIQQDYLEFS
ncbi:hypothetical protein IV73_GL001096 [Weissella kandleri]|uniref:Septation ring formation regulator EzrA n=1 Tax=Weissella kandleri TaxID=1616 RepID=A0A0R2JBZ0_9LACO|nr:septation ring formation regulator EzrA [Weissella kandleri]KRN74819.1 hypothetical protein IV73_GL001096 [Weissella kandleri]